MALITFDHSPKFVSFNPRDKQDMDEVRRQLPHRTRLSMPVPREEHRGARMHAWCNLNCEGRYARIWQGDDIIVMFECINDAIMFKLIWA